MIWVFLLLLQVDISNKKERVGWNGWEDNDGEEVFRYLERKLWVEMRRKGERNSCVFRERDEFE